MTCEACDNRGWTLRDARIQVCDCGTYDPPKWVTRGDAACVIGHYQNPDRPRRAYSGYACLGHRDALEDRIRRLPRLFADLGLALTASERHDNEGCKPKKATSLGIALNERIVEARREIHDELVRLVRVVAEGQRRTDLPADRVANLASWLADETDWLCAQLDIDETVAYVGNLGAHKWLVPSPGGQRTFPIGVNCLEPLFCLVTDRTLIRCAGQLVAILMADDDREELSEVACDSCERQVPMTAVAEVFKGAA